MDILSILHGLFGLAVVIGIAFLFSNNKRKVNWRLVGTGVTLQFIFAFIIIKTEIGKSVFHAISGGFVKLLDFTTEGASFVFGPLAIGPAAPGTMGFFFAFQVLPTIIFFFA